MLKRHQPPEQAPCREERSVTLRTAVAVCTGQAHETAVDGLVVRPLQRALAAWAVGGRVRHRGLRRIARVVHQVLQQLQPAFGGQTPQLALVKPQQPAGVAVIQRNLGVVVALQAQVRHGRGAMRALQEAGGAHATRSTRMASSTDELVRSTPSISPISSSKASSRWVLGARSVAR